MEVWAIFTCIQLCFCRSPAVLLEREKAVELARRAQQVIDRPSHLVALRAFHVHGRAFVVSFSTSHFFH